MTPRDAARVVLVVFGFLTVQETLMLDIRIGGIHPDIMVLLPMAAGLVGGPGRGATMGFGAGLVADCLLPTPFGLSAFIGTMIGYGVGLATVAVDRSSWWLPTAAALVSSVLYEVLYPLFGSILGQPQMLHVPVARIALLVAVCNAVLAVPAVRLVAWALPKVSTEGMPTSTSGLLR
ncbi:MAG TPA: rod shape-determining protein MreD [Acidimicrobiales bacterium]|jgi:rod shape-determining protein MreD|nr:rod shape-determining protein MreD [Acidimicrobiales bacterium]